MSPELETLDQLLGGEMPLNVIRRIYADDESFAKSMKELLASGDIRLLAGDEVPKWQWKELLADGGWKRQQTPLTLAITESGANRIT